MDEDKSSDVIQIEDPDQDEFFDASPHTSEDEKSDDKSDLSDEDEAEEDYYDTSEVRDLLSSVHDFVSRESESADEHGLRTIPEDVLQEMKGEVDFYKTNLMQVESKYSMLLESYKKAEQANHEKEQVLKKYLVSLQRASLSPEYVIEMQETIIKLKEEISVLQKQILSMNDSHAIVNNDKLEMANQKWQILEEENKLLKETVTRLQKEAKSNDMDQKDSNESFEEKTASPVSIEATPPEAAPTPFEDRALGLLLSDKFLDEFTKRIVDKIQVGKKQMPRMKSKELIRGRTLSRGSAKAAEKSTRKRKLATVSSTSSRVRPKSPRPPSKRASELEIKPLSIY